MKKDEPNKKKVDHQYCQELARHLMHPSGLPKDCQKFQDVMIDLKRRDTDTAHPTQWLS